MLNYGDVSVNYSYVMLYDPLNPIIMVWMFFWMSFIRPRIRFSWIMHDLSVVYELTMSKWIKLGDL